MTRGWLLDTNVVSELFKGARADRSVLQWVERAEESRLFLSVITLGEIAKSIALAEARGRDMRGQRDFLDRALPERFGERIRCAASRHSRGGFAHSVLAQPAGL